MLLVLGEKKEARKIFKKILSFESRNIHDLLMPVVLHLLTSET